MSEVDALQGALAGEHAAIYAYGVVGARLGGTGVEAARLALATHRNRRGQLRDELLRREVVPVASGAAYALPFGVTGSADAVRLAVLVEDRLAALYLSLVEATTDRRLRTLGAAAVQQVAVEAARWRRLGTLPQSTEPFPGR